MAGQQTMSRLIGELTGQPFGLAIHIDQSHSIILKMGDSRKYPYYTTDGF